MIPRLNWWSLMRPLIILQHCSLSTSSRKTRSFSLICSLPLVNIWLSKWHLIWARIVMRFPYCRRGPSASWVEACGQTSFIWTGNGYRKRVIRYFQHKVSIVGMSSGLHVQDKTFLSSSYQYQRSLYLWSVS